MCNRVTVNWLPVSNPGGRCASRTACSVDLGTGLSTAGGIRGAVRVRLITSNRGNITVFGLGSAVDGDGWLSRGVKLRIPAAELVEWPVAANEEWATQMDLVLPHQQVIRPLADPVADLGFKNTGSDESMDTDVGNRRTKTEKDTSQTMDVKITRSVERTRRRG